MKDYKQRVYNLVKKIPNGRVTTYGAIGKKLEISPRVVGYALHLNPYKGKVPCHRVVNREGRVAPNFAFGGNGMQKKLLEAEGVIFRDEMHVEKDRILFNL